MKTLNDRGSSRFDFWHKTSLWRKNGQTDGIYHSYSRALLLTCCKKFQLFWIFRSFILFWSCISGPKFSVDPLICVWSVSKNAANAPASQSRDVHRIMAAMFNTWWIAGTFYTSVTSLPLHYVVPACRLKSGIADGVPILPGRGEITTFRGVTTDGKRWHCLRAPAQTGAPASMARFLKQHVSIILLNFSLLRELNKLIITKWTFKIVLFFTVFRVHQWCQMIVIIIIKLSSMHMVCILISFCRSITNETLISIVMTSAVK